ncbi:hypothetical protein [Bradyrhizobium sp. LHD-71]|nr:hypothetical protein [Bradyrhizobium sp. LHD-71]MDQ8726332.1 hypothetical protein [Bradyrhizobium sp. LHD-71]
MTKSRVLRLVVFFLTMGFVFPNVLQEGGQETAAVEEQVSK